MYAMFLSGLSLLLGAGCYEIKEIRNHSTLPSLGLELSMLSMLKRLYRFFNAHLLHRQVIGLRRG